MNEIELNEQISKLVKRLTILFKKGGSNDENVEYNDLLLDELDSLYYLKYGAGWISTTAKDTIVERIQYELFREQNSRLIDIGTLKIVENSKITNSELKAQTINSLKELIAMADKNIVKLQEELEKF